MMKVQFVHFSYNWNKKKEIITKKWKKFDEKLFTQEKTNHFVILISWRFTRLWSGWTEIWLANTILLHDNWTGEIFYTIVQEKSNRRGDSSKFGKYLHKFRSIFNENSTKNNFNYWESSALEEQKRNWTNKGGKNWKIQCPNTCFTSLLRIFDDANNGHQLYYRPVNILKHCNIFIEETGKYIYCERLKG